MKKVFLIFSIISCVMTTFAQTSFYVYKTDGSATKYLINDVDSISFTAPDNTENGYEYVDLGLPSGLKWATCNVGATKPEEYGDYFAWGETTIKSNYNSSTHTYSSNPTTLPLNKDAASVNMGGSWRMPTYDEIEELKTKCTWTWTTLNGFRGYNVEGPNGNAIFLPAAGCRSSSDLDFADTNGFYWSSSLSSDYYSYKTNNLSFNSGRVYWDNYSRHLGLSVRGVCP